MMEITDEMVERAMNAMWTNIPPQINYFEMSVVRGELLKLARRGLTAALNPPAAPEVPITRDMADAGGAEYRRCREEEKINNRKHSGAP